MEEALRYNEGKPALAQILEFGSGLDKLAKVMSQGAIKYTPRNWLKGGKPDEEYLSAALRHMEAFVNEGEWDKDNGTHHIAHAAWNMLALLTLNRDDLPDLDPMFDQDAFLSKYTEEPDALREVVEHLSRNGSIVLPERENDPAEWVNKRVVTTLGADVWVRGYDADRGRYLVEGFGGEQYMTDLCFDPVFDG